MKHFAIVLAGTIALAACETEQAAPTGVIIAPGAAEAEFLVARPDAVPLSELSPEGAEIMRAFLETPRNSYGALLAYAALGFDCGRFPVNQQTLPDFERFVGRSLLRANGMPDEDIPLVADRVGFDVVSLGISQLPDDDFVYDGAGNLVGLARCA